MLVVIRYTFFRTERLARDIFNDLDLSKPLATLCVLKGGYLFYNDLLQYIQNLSANAAKSCPVSIDFIRLKSYEVSSRFQFVINNKLCLTMVKCSFLSKVKNEREFNRRIKRPIVSEKHEYRTDVLFS